MRSQRGSLSGGLTQLQIPSWSKFIQLLSTFYPRVQQDPLGATSSMLRTSSSTDSTTSATQIAVEYDRIDVGGGQLVEKSSRSRRIVKSRKTSAPLTSMLKTSSSTDSSTSAIQIAVGYGGVDGADGKPVEKSSKSQRIVKESKSFKGLKNLQRPSVRRNVYQSTNSPPK